jgi:predicted O-methyltransferase YrrM
VEAMARRDASQAPVPRFEPTAQQYEGQLDNQDLEELVSAIVERQGWGSGSHRTVVEIGTGGGAGSTVSIHRALTAGNCQFELLCYEGDPKLAMHAASHWAGVQDVQIVNEYFVHREDIDLAVLPRIPQSDRETYLPYFEAVATADNFLATPPAGEIDLLFIDSVRYTHLAILRAAMPWLRPETVVLMEDDIPGFGELAIVKSELRVRRVTRHEIGASPWPFVELRVVGRARRLARALGSLTGR